MDFWRDGGQAVPSQPGSPCRGLQTAVAETRAAAPPTPIPGELESTAEVSIGTPPVLSVNCGGEGVDGSNFGGVPPLPANPCKFARTCRGAVYNTFGWQAGAWLNCLPIARGELPDYARSAFEFCSLK